MNDLSLRHLVSFSFRRDVNWPIVAGGFVGLVFSSRALRWADPLWCKTSDSASSRGDIEPLDLQGGPSFMSLSVSSDALEATCFRFAEFFVLGLGLVELSLRSTFFLCTELEGEGVVAKLAKILNCTTTT